MKKIDMKRLKADIKAASQACIDAKKARKEAERAVSAYTSDSWSERRKLIDASLRTRADVADAKLAVTRLCVFRASLRGKTHLTENSEFACEVAWWIEAGQEKYALPPEPAMEAKAVG